MKTLTTVAAITLTTLSFAASAAMDPQIEKTLIAVCKAGASNNIFTYANTMRDYRINEQRVFPRLVCNDQSFHQFALSHGANRTAAKIERYIKGRVTIQDIAMNIPEEEMFRVYF
ncbi:DUF3718 domain-containing protein [Shewanella salipaludis]|uniref:DUF3718 domain-containing protein n=1 Tax=Shewanella salipaludis TaxID=2723052 RepID=A0A972FR30_9GAMM|nr:DUF3718 domain-containing protein [Shewanella salipaludis]NMH64570.1 DUF3718 domain-containing protein [Shewanella salipaludis]